jgi:hypothetical protein
VTSRYGPGKARRMLRCRACKARFSERKGTPLFDARLPPETVEAVLEHVAVGCGVRQTGRLCRVHPDTVTKRREKGRVVEVGTRVVFGSVAAVLLALGESEVSRAINTAFLERENGTDRHRNARKARATYRFSKDWRYHEAVTYLTLYSYNFCWPVRTLAAKDEAGRLRRRSPAMAAGLTDHVWTMSEWLAYPAVQRC